MKTEYFLSVFLPVYSSRTGQLRLQARCYVYILRLRSVLLKQPDISQLHLTLYRDDFFETHFVVRMSGCRALALLCVAGRRSPGSSRTTPAARASAAAASCTATTCCTTTSPPCPSPPRTPGTPRATRGRARGAGRGACVTHRSLAPWLP